MRRTRSRSKCLLRAFSVARGAISRSENSRAVRRMSCCSSLSSKSMWRTLPRGAPPSGGVDSRALDPLTIAMLVLAGLLLGGILLLGRFYPGSGAEQLDWRPTRSAEVEARNDVDDVVQMREAINAKRRRRGAPELTEEGLQAQVREDLHARLRAQDGEREPRA